MEIRTLLSDQAKKPRFDASILGWRIGPYRALVEAGVEDPNPSLSCDARKAGRETATNLDFSIGYLPPNLNVGTTKGPMKWLCGNDGFSVSYNIEIEGKFGVGQLGLDRFVQTERVLELDVPNDSVEAATVNGRPAILIHPADDATGLGLGVVIVIEDDIGPELTILRVFSDDAMPFAELIKVAEGIK
jgi:hypothetical protein